MVDYSDSEDEGNETLKEIKGCCGQHREEGPMNPSLGPLMFAPDLCEVCPATPVSSLNSKT